LDHGLCFEGLRSLPGDLSTRRYFRARCQGRSVIVAHYPPEAFRTARRFLETTALFEAASVPVPAVLNFDCEHGVMLLTDEGTENLYEASLRLSKTGTETRIEAASHWIGAIQEMDRDLVEDLSPPLDATALFRELEQTWEYYLSPQGLDGPGTVLWRALQDLCSNLGGEGLVPCHRDFMARNLLIGLSPARPLALIDHQDLRLGPRFYDLGSLLNDSLFSTASLEAPLLERFAPSLPARIDYHRAVVQRTLKAIGTFCRFAESGHLQHLPLVEPSLRRAWSQLPSVPELRHLPPLLQSSWRLRLDG
jgi:aminoglycoside/choline kinase family phosphotransferase